MTATAIDYLSQEWHADRKTYIGSSEFAMLAGVSPYGDAHDLYLAKVEDNADARERNAKAKRRGLLFEPVIAQLYQDEFPDVQLEQIPTVRHPEYPWIGSTPDRIAVTRNGVRYIVEFKTVHATKIDEWGAPGTDEVPDHYFVQAVMQAETLKVPFVHIVAVFGFDDLRVYPVMRNDDMAADLIALGASFREKSWLPRIEPPIGGPNRERNLKRKYLLHTDHLLTADEAQNAKILEYFAARRERERFEALEESAKCDLIEIIGHNKGIIGRAGRISYTSQKGKKTVKVDSLCKAFNITETQLEEHTVTGDPFRVFRPTAIR